MVDLTVRLPHADWLLNIQTVSSNKCMQGWCLESPNVWFSCLWCNKVSVPAAVTVLTVIREMHMTVDGSI